MDIENLITETLTAHEHVAADGDRVYAAAQKRIDRGRTMSRPLAVGAGVVALTVAAATVVVLNRSDSPSPTQAAGPATLASATAAAAASAIADLPMPFALEWLPPGKVDYLARRINQGATAEEPDVPIYGGEYMLTVKAGGRVLDIDVQQFKMTPIEDAAFKSGPGSPVTVGGQPGVESSVSDGPGGYELYLAHDGGSMYVNVNVEHGSTATAQELTDIGRRVAEGIRFPGTATVTPTFGLGALPNGLRMCAFDVEHAGDRSVLAGPTGLTTSYTVGTCATESSAEVGTNTVNEPSGTPGQPVQGHETRYSDDHGYHLLWILDAVNGAAVRVAGSIPVTDLYTIANGLVLPK